MYASAMKLPTQVTSSQASVRWRENQRATRSSNDRTPPSSWMSREPAPIATAVMST